jgi:hypothetical protein
MNTAVEVLRRERDQAKEQINALRARVREMDDAINLLEGNVGNSPSAKADGDLKDMVFQLVVGAGKVGTTPRDIAQKLSMNGRPTSDASVSSTLSRLKRDDNKVYNDRGYWYPVSERAPENVERPPQGGDRGPDFDDEIEDADGLY